MFLSDHTIIAGKNKPYIQNIGEYGNFIVWIVDGDYVRDHLDIDFTNFASQRKFKFIPDNEFWIDYKKSNQAEIRFFIDNMLAQERYMDQGDSYDKAREKADKLEQKERKKSEDIDKLVEKNKRPEDFSAKKSDVEKCHIEILDEKDSVEIWLIDGEIVRDLFDIDFTEGGHGFVYSYVPRKEIWIDNDLLPEERKFVILHELTERNKMKEKSWSYDKAHDFASKKELEARHLLES